MKNEKFCSAKNLEEHRLFKAALELSKAKPGTVDWMDKHYLVLLYAQIAYNEQKIKNNN